LKGHAIEARINAEDPADKFRPSPGAVTDYRAPGGPGTRFDTLLYQGCQISPFYDSLIGKLIVWDETRDGALRRMRRALEELIVEGVATTAQLHQDLAGDETVRKGDFHTRWLEDWLSSRENLAASRRRQA
jgi:acetyl-CoA carboxylase biotin carboxylase subunit